MICRSRRALHEQFATRCPGPLAAGGRRGGSSCLAIAEPGTSFRSMRICRIWDVVQTYDLSELRRFSTALAKRNRSLRLCLYYPFAPQAPEFYRRLALLRQPRAFASLAADGRENHRRFVLTLRVVTRPPAVELTNLRDRELKCGDEIVTRRNQAEYTLNIPRI